MLITQAFPAINATYPRIKLHKVHIPFTRDISHSTCHTFTCQIPTTLQKQHNFHTICQYSKQPYQTVDKYPNDIHVNPHFKTIQYPFLKPCYEIRKIKVIMKNATYSPFLLILNFSGRNRFNSKSFHEHCQLLHHRSIGPCYSGASGNQSLLLFLLKFGENDGKGLSQTQSRLA